MTRRRWVLALAIAAALTGACASGPQVDKEAPWPFSEVRPDCGGGNRIFALAAQAVPSATVLPCLDNLLTGWDYDGMETTHGRFRFWLDSDRAGVRSVEVTLVASCDVSDAIEVAPGPDEAGTRRFEEPISLAPTFAAQRFYTFPGGCVQVSYRFATDDSVLVLQADQAIGFRPRQPIVDRLAAQGLVLCGAGAPECPGGE